jgi:hypothetical protein
MCREISGWVGIAQSVKQRATGWMVRVQFPVLKDFLCSTAFRPTLGPTQPPTQWVTGIKRQGREADNSPSSSAEVKKGGAIPLFPPTSSW